MGGPFLLNLRLFVLVLTVFSLSLEAREGGSGMCVFEGGTTPGLPNAVCYFPTCPGGGDCLPPTVDKASAKIDYFEPLMQWKDRCPSSAFPSCWEVYADFKLSVAATDPAGVAFIGVHIGTDAGGIKQTKKYWAKAESREANGRYELSGGIVVHVPPGQRLTVSVNELCARDSLNNEGCVSPVGRGNFQFQPK